MHFHSKSRRRQWRNVSSFIRLFQETYRTACLTGMFFALVHIEYQSRNEFFFRVCWSTQNFSEAKVISKGSYCFRQQNCCQLCSQAMQRRISEFSSPPAVSITVLSHLLFCSTQTSFLVIFFWDSYNKHVGINFVASYHIIPESHSHLSIAFFTEMKAVCSKETQIWLAIL